MDFFWDADFRDHERFVVAESKHSKHEAVIPDLATFTDEEFFERMAAMKRDHQRTLELCDSVGLKPAVTIADSPSHKPSLPVASVNHDYVISTKSYCSPAGDLISTTGRDIRRPFKARKAPSRPKVQTNIVARQLRTKRKADLNQSPSNSNDGEQLNDMKAYMMERYLTTCKNELAITKELWDELYALKKFRHSSSRSFPRPKSFDNSWRHQVTIPKPFAMTIRESSKPRPMSRSMADFERMCDEQTRKEMQECNKKFKASPAPANIYIPLYEELTKDREKQRALNAAQKLREFEELRKPYAFLLREDERLAKKNQRQILFAASDANIPDAVFRAKPFPEHIYNSEANESMRQQELMRQEERLNRAEAMLQLSSLPQNMKKNRPKHNCEMSQEGDARRRSQSPVRKNASNLLPTQRSTCLEKNSTKHHCEIEELMTAKEESKIGRMPEKWPMHSLRNQSVWRSLTDLLSDSRENDSSVNVRNSITTRNPSTDSSKSQRARPATGCGVRRPPVPKPHHSRTSRNQVGKLRTSSSIADEKLRQEIENDLRNMDLSTH